MSWRAFEQTAGYGRLHRKASVVLGPGQVSYLRGRGGGGPGQEPSPGRRLHRTWYITPHSAVKGLLCGTVETLRSTAVVFTTVVDVLYTTTVEDVFYSPEANILYRCVA